MSLYHFLIIRNTLRNEDLNSMDLQYTYKILFNDISFWNHIWWLWKKKFFLIQVLGWSASKRLANLYDKFTSVQFSRSVVSDSSWPHELQHARPPCSSPTLGVCPNPCPSSWYAIQPSHPLSSPSLPAPNPSQHQGLFQWVNSSHEVAKGC